MKLILFTVEYMFLISTIFPQGVVTVPLRAPLVYHVNKT